MIESPEKLWTDLDELGLKIEQRWDHFSRYIYNNTYRVEHLAALRQLGSPLHPTSELLGFPYLYKPTFSSALRASLARARHEPDRSPSCPVWNSLKKWVGVLVISSIALGDAGDWWLSRCPGCAERLIRSIKNTAAKPACRPGLAVWVCPEVYEVGCHQGLPFMVQEFLEGVTLCEALKRGPYGEEASLALLQDLARTLAVVHERGLVHRDIKPANILISQSGQARLIDFGLATRSHLGKDASLTGTFRYSAPEQTGMLERPLDGRADLYSLGVVLYECLSGRPPFLEEDAAELIRLHAVAPPPDLAGLAPQVSPLLVAAVQRLLAKDR